MPFQCPRAKGVWAALGLENMIEQACNIHYAGEAVLEFLVDQPMHQLPVLGLGRMELTVAIGLGGWK